MREGRRPVLLVVALLAVAATLSTGGVSRLPGSAPAAGVPAASADSDAAYPDLQPLFEKLPTTGRFRPPATGIDVQLACPTQRAPGCALSFIRHDAGWRIHPVYGYHSCHTGIDLRGNYGDRIRAAAGGVVIRTGLDPAYGRYTLIQVNPVVRTYYAHQSHIEVQVGEQVAQGEVIGRVGATGFATGPHLHFEVHVHDRPYDPDGWFGAKRKVPVGCYPGVKY